MASIEMLAPESTLHFYNDRLLVHCTNNLQENSLKNDKMARSRRLLDQILNEIKNSNVLLDATFYKSSAARADSQPESNRIEQVLQME